jgi:hypothetical protein
VRGGERYAVLVTDESTHRIAGTFRAPERARAFAARANARLDRLDVDPHLASPYAYVLPVYRPTLRDLLRPWL